MPFHDLTVEARQPALVMQLYHKNLTIDSATVATRPRGEAKNILIEITYAPFFLPNSNPQTLQQHRSLEESKIHAYLKGYKLINNPIFCDSSAKLVVKEDDDAPVAVNSDIQFKNVQIMENYVRRHTTRSQQRLNYATYATFRRTDTEDEHALQYAGENYRILKVLPTEKDLQATQSELLASEKIGNSPASVSFKTGKLIAEAIKLRTTATKATVSRHQNDVTLGDLEQLQMGPVVLLTLTRTPRSQIMPLLRYLQAKANLPKELLKHSLLQRITPPQKKTPQQLAAIHARLKATRPKGTAPYTEDRGTNSGGRAGASDAAAPGLQGV